MYTTMCKTDSWCKSAIKHRKLSSLLCDDLDGWDGGGVGRKFKREGTYIYTIYIIYIYK